MNRRGFDPRGLVPITARGAGLGAAALVLLPAGWRWG
jgi:hypothetical protein